MRLVMLGLPGVGKGTQARKLSERYHAPNISTGDILREAMQKKTPLGLKAKTYMESGELVPDSIVIGIVEEKLRGENCTNGWILDGFPRTLQQAVALDGMLERIKTSINYVLNLDVEEDEVIKRLSGRRNCESCQNTYNINFNLPAEEGVCDLCGGKLVQRSDDREETVWERLRVYRERTEPLVNYYQERGFLRKIDAKADIEMVFDEICSQIQ